MQIQKIFFISYLISITVCTHLMSSIVPYYSIRSQSVDAARELTGWTHHINLADKDRIYGSFSITPEYTQSFNSNAISRSLFGIDACTPIVISGSQVANRGVNDWLADYFYLPTDFTSIIQFQPTIRNALVDINTYFGLDRWVQGLFFRIHAPLTWTSWNLHFTEKVTNAGVNNYSQGYFAPTIIYRDTLFPNFTKYAHGNSITDLQRTNTSIPAFNGLDFAQISPCAQTLVRLAEIQMVLGWNFLECEDYHVGAGLRLAVPTGNRVEGKFLFEPIVGNGKHWEVGAHITGHVSLWKTEDEEHEIGFYCDTNITHLFAARQTRTFDLKNKPFSRYMLAENLGVPIINGLVGASGTIPSFQFQNIPQTSASVPRNGFQPVANITTQDVRVEVAVQVDLAAQLTYAHHGFTWDLGYNLWARSCENIGSICPTAGCQFVELNESWALKGDASVFGFASAVDTVKPTLMKNQAVPLSATNSAATIHAGTNFPATNNPNIDNPQLALAGGAPAVALNVSTTNATQINTSIQPVFITGNQLDIVANRGLSNKLYSHLSYAWLEHECLLPYVGAGVFAEFGYTNQHKTDCSCIGSSSCSTTCTITCFTSSLSQWGVWLKGGFSF